MEFFFHDLHNDVLILAVDGGLDLHTSRQFTESVQKIADMGVKKIVVDCSALSYISSTGLAGLLLLNKRMTARGADVKIAGARSGIIDLLRLTRLDGVFELHPDVARAVLEFKPKDSSSTSPPLNATAPTDQTHAPAEHTPTLDKPTLRALMRERLASLSQAARDRGSVQMIDTLLASDLLPPPGAGPVMGYASAPGLHEPDLDILWTTLIERGYRVCMPRFDASTKAMTPVLIASIGDLQPSSDASGLSSLVRQPAPPPDDTAPIEPASLSLIVLPGLAFDFARRRLGRGAGFYDRFLALLEHSPADPRRIALAFDQQIIERVPTQPHDRPVDAVVTPTRIIQAH